MPFLYSELYYVLLFISGVTNAATKHNCLITEYKPHADKLHVKRCLIPNKVVVLKLLRRRRVNLIILFMTFIPIKVKVLDSNLILNETEKKLFISVLNLFIFKSNNCMDVIV